MSKSPESKPAEQKQPDPELQKFKDELVKKEALIADYTDHLKRLQAEFENYCKRTEKERKQVAEFASERLIVKLLLVIDDFERALAQFKDILKEVADTQNDLRATLAEALAHNSK